MSHDACSGLINEQLNNVGHGLSSNLRSIPGFELVFQQPLILLIDSDVQWLKLT